MPAHSTRDSRSQVGSPGIEKDVGSPSLADKLLARASRPFARVEAAEVVKRWAVLLAVVLQPLLEEPARAEEPAPPASAAPSPKREVPDYDGRGPAPAPPGQALLWVPRVVLSPLYVVSEYVIRKPLSIAIPAAERADVPRKVYDFFTWGPEHKVGIVPVGYLDFDFNPSFGAYAFWKDALAKDNDWSLHAEAWPTDWYAVSFKESARLDDRHTILFHLSGVHRPDRVFYGVGSRSLQSSQSRFTEAVVDQSATLDWKYLRESRVQLALGLRSASTGPGSYNSDPSLDREAATGAFAIPYGFGRRYSAFYRRIVATTAARGPWRAPGSGARLEAQAEEGSDMQSSSGAGWVRYGATASGFLDLDWHQRVISLSAATQFVDPLGGSPIPFTELVSLGGDGPMRGYWSRRMIDRSAASAALHYVWPIGPWLGGNIEAGVGNVFGEHLQGFRPGLLRFSGDIGITTVGVSDYPIELIVGAGSETFEQGGQIDSIRATLSVNHGF